MKVKAKFPFGQVVSTPLALSAMQEAGVMYEDLMDRHISGDWGIVSDADKVENDWSINNDCRILSAYKIKNDQVVWCITEADRSSTTFILPSEY